MCTFRGLNVTKACVASHSHKPYAGAVSNEPFAGLAGLAGSTSKYYQIDGAQPQYDNIARRTPPSISVFLVMMPKWFISARLWMNKITRSILQSKSHGSGP